MRRHSSLQPSYARRNDIAVLWIQARYNTPQMDSRVDRRPSCSRIRMKTIWIVEEAEGIYVCRLIGLLVAGRVTTTYSCLLILSDISYHLPEDVCDFADMLGIEDIVVLRIQRYALEFPHCPSGSLVVEAVSNGFLPLLGHCIW